MIRPTPLVKGNTIGIAAPASRANETFVHDACVVLESWGFKVTITPHCQKPSGVYLSAPDRQRLSDFQHLLDNPGIRTIICARGGYGTTRILDNLSFENFLKYPKWIVGFSDITALHLKLHAIGVESVHGCMPVQFHKGKYAESIDSLRKLITGEARIPIIADGHVANRQGTCTGRAIGGNLSLLADSLGTGTSPDTSGKILILEDVGEPLYKIDRMLMQLKRAGKLSRLAGLAIGYFTGTTDGQRPFDESLEQIVLSKVSEFHYPVSFGLPIGHEAPNLPWCYSAMATLEVSSARSALLFA